MSEKKLRQVVYVSSAREKYSAARIRSLLEVSRRNNRRDGITGMLLYRSGNFIQAIEGPPDAIEDLMERLHRDPDHHGMIVMLDRMAEERDFKEWTMGFRDVSGISADSLPGAIDFWDNPAGADPADSSAERLLEIFRATLSS